MQRILFIVLLGLLPLRVAADGMVFPPTAFPARVEIPDQRALIHFTNGVERLVIETRFTGAGTNFAWVVPLPSQPIVEAASTGLFPTLQYYFQSPISHRVPRFYLGIGLVIGLLLLLRLLICTCSSPISGIMIFLLLLLAGAVLLPALLPAKSRSAGMSESSTPSVSILDRQLVGVFETTTIASQNPQALQLWLRENGFLVSTNSEPVIADYVKDGWVFVAAKIRRDRPENQTSTPHPLSFTFKTHRPVYPMRLTGTGDRPLQVELYVFADQRAYAQHFKVQRCTRPEYPAEPNYGYRPQFEKIKVMHPLLRSWVGGAPVATKLTATLTPEMMQRDVWLDWRGFSETEGRRFSYAGALTIALNCGGIVLLLGLIWAYVYALSVRPGNPKFSAPVQLAFAISLVIGGVIYLALPKIEVRLARGVRVYSRSNQQHVLQMLYGQTLSEARQLLLNPTNTASAEEWERYGKNHYFGVLIHEEDSPGNFTLREKNGYIDFVVYDALGADSLLSSWPVKAEK